MHAALNDECHASYEEGMRALDAGNLKRALALAGRLLQQAPDSVEGLRLMAAAAMRDNRPDLAAECLQKAMSANPDDVALLTACGEALRLAWRHDEAQRMLERAVALPSESADPCYKMATLWRDRGDFHVARHWILQGKAREGCRFSKGINLAFSSLVLGGVNEEAWRWHTHRPVRQPVAGACVPLIDAETSPLTLHVHHDPDLGLGDHLFYSRFLPWLKACGHRIVYTPHPKIASIMQRIPYFDEVAEPGSPVAADLVMVDTDLPLAVARLGAPAIPPSLCLQPLEHRLDEVAARLAVLGPPPYVAVTWAAGPIHMTYVRNGTRVLPRRIEPATLGAALREIDATVLVIQRQPSPTSMEAFVRALGRPAHDLSGFNDDMEGMFALLALVDEYVGVSNTNNHVRNLLHKPSRVLVNQPVHDWAFLAQGRASPWHAGSTLYRQAFDGDWSAALKALRGDLGERRG